MSSYSDFFTRITGGKVQPFPFQERFHAEPSEYTALIVPTGLGKTQTVLADWLYRRPTTRLLWILPGRALTAQVAGVARAMSKEVDSGIQVLELMGGNEDLKLDLRPEQPAVLVATLDIAVSRQLNRGYARSPFRWPIDFALLNNDIQVVFDEVQLQGDALATGCQLAAFRRRHGLYGKAPCVWISATFDPQWLETVDFAGQKVREVRLDALDLANETVKKRWLAEKQLSAAAEECRTAKGVAEFVRAEHRPGTLTLVIVNTVPRAREVYEELKDTTVTLLHSRFRRDDRDRQMQKLKDVKSGIIVSTQVIEAGMDLDADLLITDPAPWASLVQRFGRVNRYGERGGSRIFWIDRPLKKDKKVRKPEEDFAPYPPGEVESALSIIGAIHSAAPADLPAVEGPVRYENVLRSQDLLDLFDTTPDLAGNQLDISRFVRSGDDTDVYFAWRDWAAKDRPDKKPKLEDAEFCPVPISEAKIFVKNHEGWTWTFANRGYWTKVNQNAIYPGMRILFRGGEGGYNSALGWQQDSKSKVPAVQLTSVEKDVAEEATDDDPISFRASGWVTLSVHTQDVISEMERLQTTINGFDLEWDALLAAARFHDWGKAHEVFQETMHRESGAPDRLLAKSPFRGGHKVKFFRHELASALAVLQAGHSDLEAYLIAAHHGKVRMNIRSLPEEQFEEGERISRGIREGDVLPESEFGGPVPLSLESSNLGRGENGSSSWSSRANRLLEQFGPFRLAYLEMLLRTADGAASAAPSEIL